MLPVDEAIRSWLEAISLLETETVSLRDALGRVAAQEVHFTEDLPPFANSAMDGYAFRHEDAGRDALQIVGEVAAGQVRDEPVASGQTVRIMTGSPVPTGADTVVPIEDVDESGETIHIRVAPAKGAHIRPAGDDVRTGDPIASTGDVLDAGHLASLAASGILQIAVRRRPRVAVLTTGDEVVSPEESPPPGAIRNSNQVLLKAMLHRRGVEMTTTDHVADDLDEMKAWMRTATDGAQRGAADLIVTTGGVSVGRYDLVRPLLSESGFEEIFWRVRMKPGKPIVTARRGTVYACGLPGNPVSAFVGMLLYVIPALDRLEGRTRSTLTWHAARLTEPVSAGPRTFFTTAQLRSEEGVLTVRPVPRQGSHRLSTLLGANALIRVEGGSRRDAGEEISTLLWGDL